MSFPLLMVAIFYFLSDSPYRTSCCLFLYHYTNFLPPLWNVSISLHFYFFNVKCGNTAEQKMCWQNLNRDSNWRYQQHISSSSAIKKYFEISYIIYSSINPTLDCSISETISAVLGKTWMWKSHTSIKGLTQRQTTTHCHIKIRHLIVKLSNRLEGLTSY